MLRVVLAVLFASAILAVAVPAVDRGGTEHSDVRVDAELERFETVAETLADRNDPPPPGMDGARTTVSVRLPGDRVGTAGVERFRIEPDRGAVVWRVKDGTEHVRYITAVPLSGEPVSLDSGGTHTIRLTLRSDGSVRVDRPEV